MARKFYTLFLALSLGVALSAGTPESDAKNAWFGLGAGTDKHLMADVGFTMARSGFTQWGAELGYVGLNSTDQPAESNTGIPKGGRKETDFAALQIGAWADWGRAYVAFGVERAEKTEIVNKSTTTASNFPTETTTKFGAYVKVGYRITPSISLYISGGSQSGVLGGLGFHF